MNKQLLYALLMGACSSTFLPASQTTKFSDLDPEAQAVAAVLYPYADGELLGSTANYCRDTADKLKTALAHHCDHKRSSSSEPIVTLEQYNQTFTTLDRRRLRLILKSSFGSTTPAQVNDVICDLYLPCGVPQKLSDAILIAWFAREYPTSLEVLEKKQQELASASAQAQQLQQTLTSERASCTQAQQTAQQLAAENVLLKQQLQNAHNKLDDSKRTKRHPKKRTAGTVIFYSNSLIGK